MNFRGLDLNLLVALDALLTEKSITRAGERLHLSQSATSNALARLREYFADELLTQAGHRMILTPRAEALAEPVRNLLLRTEAVLKPNLDFCPETSKRIFRIMVSDYGASVVLGGVLRELKRRAPGIGLDVWPLPDEPAAVLERGEVDLLIGPTQITSAAHPREALYTDRYVCMVWSGNPLVNDTLTAGQYLEMRHAIVKLGPHRKPAIDEEFLTGAGYHRPVDLAVSSFLLLPQMIVGTNLVATVHERMAKNAACYLPLKILPMPIEIEPLAITTQWHQIHGVDQGICWLRKMLKETVDQILDAPMDGAPIMVRSKTPDSMLVLGTTS